MADFAWDDTYPNQFGPWENMLIFIEALLQTFSNTLMEENMKPITPSEANGIQFPLQTSPNTKTAPFQ